MSSSAMDTVPGGETPQYGSIQTVTKLTQKEEGQHGGHYLLHWLPEDHAASAERRVEAAEPEKVEETSENIRYAQNIFEAGMGGKTMGVEGEAQQNGYGGTDARQIDRQHTTYRKVWICKDSTLKDGPRPIVPLSNCKACRNNKTYGANYNAAAHLRRTHFFPCKSKRGGRGKVSEGRGGLGGGEEPPMDELKNWMYEKVEVNVAGNVLQSTPPELSQIDNGMFLKINLFDDAELSQIGNDMFPEFNWFDDAVPYNHLSQSIPQNSANSYDWNNAQYGADLVSESYQFTHSAGSVFDQNFAFTAANPHK